VRELAPDVHHYSNKTGLLNTQQINVQINGFVHDNSVAPTSNYVNDQTVVPMNGHANGTPVMPINGYVNGLSNGHVNGYTNGRTISQGSGILVAR
jgi:hypothetical protein